MIRAIGTLIAVYLAICAIMFFFQRNFLYYPDTTPLETIAIGPGWGRVTTQTADGLTLAHFHKPAAAGYPTILLFHGNAGNIGHRLEKFDDLDALGVGVFLTEYRGYGGNPGKPTEDGLYADARSAVAWLADKGVAAADLVIFGASLGSGVATAMAAELADAGTPVAALVLEAPYTSIAETAQYHYPWLPARWLTLDRYDSLSRIDRINTELLVLHGEQDRTIPFALGLELFEEARAPKTFIGLPNTGHAYLLREDAAREALNTLVLKPVS
ncbi:MAG: alpha/beta hydrolase [Alphaproteobacteria bacterium]